eukprot:scaffold3134_cov414-Prasinococcus_capsulatus_cf.AAC.29
MRARSGTADITNNQASIDMNESDREPAPGGRVVWKLGSNQDSGQQRWCHIRRPSAESRRSVSPSPPRWHCSTALLTPGASRTSIADGRQLYESSKDSETQSACKPRVGDPLDFEQRQSAPWCPWHRSLLISRAAPAHTLRRRHGVHRGGVDAEGRPGRSHAGCVRERNCSWPDSRSRAGLGP